MTAVTFTKGADVGGPTSAVPTAAGNTVDTAGAASPTAAQLVNGFAYYGAAGAGVPLTLPTSAAVVAYIASRGLVPAVGMSLPPIPVHVSDGNTLTVTSGDGGQTVIYGAAGILNQTAVIYIVLSNVTAAAEAMRALVIKAT